MLLWLMIRVKIILEGRLISMLKRLTLSINQRLRWLLTKKGRWRWRIWDMRRWINVNRRSCLLLLMGMICLLVGRCLSCLVLSCSKGITGLCGRISYHQKVLLVTLGNILPLTSKLITIVRRDLLCLIFVPITLNCSDLSRIKILRVQMGSFSMLRMMLRLVYRFYKWRINMWGMCLNLTITTICIPGLIITKSD